MGVYMFRPGDNGYENALDAKLMLGEEWQSIVKDGVSTCIE